MKFAGIGILFLVLFVSCTNSKRKSNISSEDWGQVDIQYAQNFKLKQSGDLFLLEIIDPSTFKVQQIEIDPENTKRIISMTTTLNGMVCLLDQRSRIIGVSSRDFVYDEGILNQIKSGKTKEYGFDAAQMSVEKIAKGKPNVILYDIITKDFPNKDKLERLGISMIPIYDWRETHPLAKAEWIKVVGALTGNFDKACKIFTEIESNYNALKGEMENTSAKPKVMVGNMIGDIWYSPSGENYFAILIKDACGDYVYSETTGTLSLNLSLEKILKDNQETEYWINPGVAYKSTILLSNPHLIHLKAFENNTYCYSGNMNKFWEQSASRPDYVLKDLIHVFHADRNPDYNFHYYSKIKE